MSDIFLGALIKALRRVGSYEFSAAFQRRDQVVRCSRRVATIEFAPGSDVATRPGHFVGLSRPCHPTRVARAGTPVERPG